MAANMVSFNLLVSDYDLGVDWYCRRAGLFTPAADTNLGGGLRFVFLDYREKNTALAWL